MSFDLNTLWFVLVGALYLFVRRDDERRVLLNAIGPVWDGNEVWLVTAGGALFAAFPAVYATVFSGFYLVFILLLFALIFRAVAIEFRGKVDSAAWRRWWDASFASGSVLAAFLIGLAMGNLAWGVPLDPEGEYVGTITGLLTPFPILAGLTTVALFLMHGAIFLVMKTEGELHARIRSWVRPTIVGFVIFYNVTTMATLLYVPHLTALIRSRPEFFLVGLAGSLAIANIPREIHRGRDFRAFLSSSAAIATLLLLFGLGMFPDLVYSWPHPEYSLTLHNAASSPRTLRTMLVIAIIGVPLVLAYTAGIYWIFRGKVKLDPHSY